MTAAPSSPVAMPIAVTHLCVYCDYSLANIEPGSACPECGNSTAVSFSRYLMQEASERRLIKLRRGAGFVMFFAIASLFAIAAQVVVWVGATIILGNQTGVPIPMAYAAIATGIASMGSLALFLTGWWWVIARDKGMTRGATRSPSRTTAGVAIIIGWVVLLGALGVMIYWYALALQRQPMAGVADDYMLTAGMIGLATQYTAAAVLGPFWWMLYFSSVSHMHWIAVRIPNHGVARSAKRMLWLGPLLWVVGGMLVVPMLVALFFYLSLLDELRKDVVRLLAERRSEGTVAESGAG